MDDDRPGSQGTPGSSEDSAPATPRCAVCGTDLELTSPDTTRLTLLRSWTGDKAPPWDETWEGDVDEDTWLIRCVRAFCSPDHARAWVSAGHPTAMEWVRSEPPPEGSDLGCIVGCVVVAILLALVACLVVLGAAEAWRMLF
ncbi:MAG TPA: hypothetical protein VGE77_11220 [Nocardioides sp.]